MAREQSKPLILGHETADADDSRRAGYRLVLPAAPYRPEAIFSRRYFLPIRGRNFIGYRSSAVVPSERFHEAVADLVRNRFSDSEFTIAGERVAAKRRGGEMGVERG